MAGWWLTLALQAAASAAPPPTTTPPAPRTDHQWRGEGRGPTFISPVGEPFRGPDPQLIWFDQADANHDGVLTRAEYDADARRFFAELDRGHDGEIDPDDLDHYENDVAPEVHVGGGDVGGGGGRGGAGHHGPGGGHRGGSHGGGRGGDHDGVGQEGSGEKLAYAAGRQGAARFSWFDYPEPIVVMDTNFNRGIDLHEWMTAADDRFETLDKSGHGAIRRGDLPPLPPRGTWRTRHAEQAPLTEGDAPSDGG